MGREGRRPTSSVRSSPLGTFLCSVHLLWSGSSQAQVVVSIGGQRHEGKVRDSTHWCMWWLLLQRQGIVFTGQVQINMAPYIIMNFNHFSASCSSTFDK